MILNTNLAARSKKYKYNILSKLLSNGVMLFWLNHAAQLHKPLFLFSWSRDHLASIVLEHLILL